MLPNKRSPRTAMKTQHSQKTERGNPECILSLPSCCCRFVRLPCSHFANKTAMLGADKEPQVEMVPGAQAGQDLTFFLHFFSASLSILALLTCGDKTKPTVPNIPVTLSHTSVYEKDLSQEHSADFSSYWSRVPHDNAPPITARGLGPQDWLYLSCLSSSG